jgi:transposase-like protein
MSIADKEAQILRITEASFHSELNSLLEQEIRQRVIAVVKMILESALIQELLAVLEAWEGPQPRRSGYYERIADSHYGRIPDLRVPKLRWGNPRREWRILTRYRRALTGLLDRAAYLYVMGLSLRDLQEALYVLFGSLLSRGAVNQVTLRAQAVCDEFSNSPLPHTPPMLIVDGVWVDIQYTLDSFKTDRSGHRRQCREAQERVILAVLGVYDDGSAQLLHFEIAQTEEEATWRALFDHLIARGLDPHAVRLVVSDGAHGVRSAMQRCFPNAQQQRCITHKVRGLKRHMTYQNLGPPGHQTQEQLKRERWRALKQDAYEIYEAPTYEEAQERLQSFNVKWKPIEPQAVHALNWGIQSTFAFYQFAAHLHPRIRTTNLLERLFREFRTKADEIGAFPNELSCLTLFFLVMQRHHAKHDRPFMANTS